jgi:hypothetical protein
MMDTFVDGEVQRIQVMLYAKASEEPEVRFERLYKSQSGKASCLEPDAVKVARPVRQ